MLDSARRLIAPSSRSAVPPFMVMDVVAAAARLEAAGRRVIHMEIGQPAAGAPAAAIAAAQAALAGGRGGRGRLGYTESLGIPALRQRIARHYAERYGADIDAERIVVTTGSSAAFLLAFLALFEPGDRVAMASPGYPPYRNLLAALGCEAVALPVCAASRFALAPDVLLAAHRRQPLKGLLVANPANPTGTMTTESALGDLIGAAESAGIACICDEIYHGLDYEFAPQTAAKLSGNAVVINSFSKYFCMTGWRVGWMVMPEALIRPVERLQQNLAISVPTLSQVAAAAAFDGRAEMEAVKRGYEVNRRLMVVGLPGPDLAESGLPGPGGPGLAGAGFDRFPPPDGAFYIYADVSRFCDDSFAFAGRMLEEAGVAVAPGVDFDPVDGHRFIRFCYAGTAAEVSEALERIGAWLRRG
jgi:aspartate/methionine/tyrosine aminotransferase